MVSHSTATIRSYCDCGLVLEGGKVRFFNDVEAAIAAHDRNMAA
jgi:capsular polysaccharide transport system ATP-binding protein